MGGKRLPDNQKRSKCLSVRVTGIEEQNLREKSCIQGRGVCEMLRDSKLRLVDVMEAIPYNKAICLSFQSDRIKWFTADAMPFRYRFLEVRSIEIGRPEENRFQNGSYYIINVREDE